MRWACDGPGSWGLGGDGGLAGWEAWRTPGFVLDRVGMRGAQALLGTWLLLLLGPGSINSSTSVYTELIVPRQLKASETFQSEADVSYILKVEGNYKIIHLKRITFVVPNMPVYSYNMKGDRIADYPYIQDDCYYNGYVEDIVDSQVVLSNCNGLRGHLQIESVDYEIEPIANSATFQHLIYQRAQEDHGPCRGTLEDAANLTRDLAQIPTVYNDNSKSSGREKDISGFHAPVQYLEFYSVVDRSKLFPKMQNETQLVQNILTIMANVHSIYLGIGLHIYLVGLELWTERDHITTGKTLSETLNEFQIYASYQLLHRINFDHANLITTRGHRLGLTSGEHYCQYNSASVSVVRSVGSLRSDADQIAHELGHSLGFFHDNLGRHCDCNCVRKPGFCIMHSNYGTGVCRRLSDCSRRLYYDLIRKPGKECLLNKPAKGFKPTLCGNGAIDGDEDCDCGHDEECRQSGCCQTNCKFTPGMDCLDGLCCRNCKYLPERTMCRKVATECDLAEYCTGTAADCPADVYKQDGTPCRSGDRCYIGQCSNLQRHCVALFVATVAPLSCFEEVNMRGDRSGNCGEEGLTFRKCKKEDALCGRLQCTNIENIPVLSTGQAVLQTPVEKATCWGTEFHLSLDADDLGAVRDGTSCGAGKICINRSCVGLEVLQYDCDFNRCHNRGVCNNRKNCHCTYGWAPPFCEGKGYGGSVDSGPPPVYTSNLALIIAVAALIGVVLFAVLIISVLKREQLKAWFAKSYNKQEPLEPEPIPEPEETPEPEPLPLPQHTSPVKHTLSQHTSLLKRTSHPPRIPEPEPIIEPQRKSSAKRTPLPEPAPQPHHTPQPEPTPQPQLLLQPEPRPHLEQTKTKRRPAQKPSRGSS